VAEMLLEREILDGNEVMMLIRGETLGPRPAKDTADQTQQVIRPESRPRVSGTNPGLTAP